jgi:hypothetical protein
VIINSRLLVCKFKDKLYLYVKPTLEVDPYFYHFKLTGKIIKL